MGDAPQAFVEVRPLQAGACHSMALVVFRLRVATSRPGYDNQRRSRDSDDPLGLPLVWLAGLTEPLSSKSLPRSGRKSCSYTVKAAGPAPTRRRPARRHTGHRLRPPRRLQPALWMDAEQMIEGPRQPEGFRRSAGLIASGAGRLPSEPLGTLTAAAVCTNMMP